MQNKAITTVSIQGTALERVTYKGEPVVTFAQVDEVHERADGTASRNFRENRKRFHKGEDYFSAPIDEIRRLTPSLAEGRSGGKPITLLTKRGYLKLVKPMNDDRAWEVQGEMIDRYFMVEQNRAVAIPQTFSEALRLAADLADKVNVITSERDHAIATKAQISNKREASAMGKASAATQKAKKLTIENDMLREELGFNAKHGTVKAVQKALGYELPRNAYVDLRRWCQRKGVDPVVVPDPNFETVKAWPAQAWKEVHGINLSELFPTAH